MATINELNDKLLTTCKKVVGDDVLKAWVFIGYGWTIFVKTHESALILADLERKNPLAEKVTISEYYEEIEVNDITGELFDIINGELLGYKIEVKLRKE